MNSDFLAELSSHRDVLYVSTIFFALAVAHTFFAHRVVAFSRRFHEGGAARQLLHFLGEVEVVFGFWAFVFLVFLSVRLGSQAAVDYLNAMNFKEPVFVFVIMCMSATRPIMMLADRLIGAFGACLAKLFFLPAKVALFCSLFVLGPLSGSLVTEPVSMTVTALLLKKHFFYKTTSARFKYVMLAMLFVFVSIGGTLTHFAAPPVLMVAGPWGWDTPFLFRHFGIKALGAIVIGTALTAFFFRRELLSFEENKHSEEKKQEIPLWVSVTNLVFLAICIVYHSFIAFLIPLFLLFVGWFEVTKSHQQSLKIRESLLVGFFLGGLVTLGTLQQWWLSPLFQSLTPTSLFLGATALTAVTDNAAITYLGTLVPQMTTLLQYALVAGAVAGGGLTVIANAPNPVGHGMLHSQFGREGISPLKLFWAALPYTVLAMIFLWP